MRLEEIARVKINQNKANSGKMSRIWSHLEQADDALCWGMECRRIKKFGTMRLFSKWKVRRTSLRKITVRNDFSRLEE